MSYKNAVSAMTCLCLMQPLKCGPLTIAYPTVHERYRGTRETAHFLAQRDLASEFPGLKLTNITEDALTVYQATWSRHLRHPRCRAWDWWSIADSFNSNPKHFGMAVWKEDAADSPAADLHALVIGATTRPKKTVQVSFLESFRYDQNPFKGSIFPIVETAITYYAFLLEARRIRIKDALPEVVSYYERCGFKIENPCGHSHNLVKELM